MPNQRPIILAFSDFYLPGYKSGGGMRTLVNIVERFGREYDFRIVTRDHDGKTDRRTYPNIEHNVWTPIGNASVLYLPKSGIRLAEVRRLIGEVGPDCIFLNSFFSTLTVFVMLIKKWGGLRAVPIVLAPQGELAEAGLGLKRTKKNAFIRFASRLGLYRDIVWRATSNAEAEEIEGAKGHGGKVFVAADLPPREIFPAYEQGRKPRKQSGSASFVYLSRIHPKKNPVFLLELLAGIKGNVRVDLIGPIDADKEYVGRCRELISSLPPNVEVHLCGGIEHEHVLEALSEHHFFVLPTIAENFGHVFLEAMSAGCPLLISDRTPWLSLAEYGIGWDIPLESPAEWRKVLEKCIAMESEEYSGMSIRARQFARDWVAAEEVEAANRDIFEYALRLDCGV